MWQTISRFCVITSLVLSGACASTGAVPEVPRPHSAAIKTGSDAPTRAQGGMRVYKDPVTGEFKDPPPETAQQIPIPTQKVITEAQEPPTVKESSVPGGGIEVDLKGRFHRYITATKDADGRVKIQCNPTPQENRPTQAPQ